jgi:hypothetical protein
MYLSLPSDNAYRHNERSHGRKKELFQTRGVFLRTALCVAIGNADYLMAPIPLWFIFGHPIINLFLL